MNNKTDPRVAELEALAREEGFQLPMPVDLIVYFERHGRVVDLTTGAVYTLVEVTPTAHAQAVAYLLSEVKGELPL